MVKKVQVIDLCKQDESTIEKRGGYRMYVDSESEAPDWADVQESSDGNQFYEVYEQELIDELLTPPLHEVSEDFPIQDFVDEKTESPDDLEYKIVFNDFDALQKWRIYIDDESMAPDWAYVEEGERGGVYYDIYEEELVSELLQEPKHEVADDFPIHDYVNEDWEYESSTYSSNSSDLPDTLQKRRYQIYVDDASNAPDWAYVFSGVQGGRYYVVHNKPLFEELMNPPKHEVSDDFPIEDYVDNPDAVKSGPERDYWRVYVDEEEEAPEWATVMGPSSDGNLYYPIFDEQLFRELVSEPEHEVPDNYPLEDYLAVGHKDKGKSIEKRRIYIDDRSEAPDGIQVEEGPEGGLYYEVGGKDPNSQGEGGNSQSIHGSDYGIDTEFGRRLGDAVISESVTDMPTHELALNIDKIRDEELLQDAYIQETREAVKAQMEMHAQNLGISLDEDYESITGGPGETKDIPEWKQVPSLADVDIDDADLSDRDKEILHTFNEYKDTEDWKRDELNEFAEDYIKEVENPAVLQHMWEESKEYNNHLDMAIRGVMDKRDYDPRVEQIPGEYRNLKDKYDIEDEHSDLERALDVLESGIITGSWFKNLHEHTDNADLLRDVKSALEERGDDMRAERVQESIVEIDPPSLDNFDIDEETYNDIKDRPAGHDREEYGINRAQWSDVRDNVSTDDLEDFAEAASARGNPQHERMAKGILYYREDSDTELEDVINFRNRGTQDIGEDEFFEDAERVFSKLDPTVGAHIMAGVEEFSLTTNTPGIGSYNYTDNELNIQERYAHVPKKNVRESVIGHEIGHSLHNLMGFQHRGEDADKDTPRDELDFGVSKPRDANVQGYKFYDDIKKLQKAWENYRDGESMEIRPYQRLNPNEFIAVTFAHWVMDSDKIKVTNPELVEIYDEYFGVEGQETDIEDITDKERQQIRFWHGDAEAPDGDE